jgi:hypothetical protein
MSDECRRLAAQLQAAMEGPAWHGPAVLELLRDVSAAQAVARPIPNAHTIWELALHLQGAYRLVLRRLRGEPERFTEADDWPPLPAEPGEVEWGETLAELLRLNGEVRDEARTTPKRLDEPLGGTGRASVRAADRPHPARPLPRGADRAAPQARPLNPSTKVRP